MLLKKFETLAKAKKCHIAYLETSEKHLEALTFYKNHGYKVIARMRNNKFHLTWYFLEKNIK
jgi:GNAT superfamily N-acetyltransferase